MEEITIFIPKAFTNAFQQEIVEHIENNEDFDDIAITFDETRETQLVIECNFDLFGDFLQSELAFVGSIKFI